MLPNTKSVAVKLQLGCGLIYKPGYINIDLFDRSVCDIVADVLFLPFKSEKIQLIEAYHVIEHFDTAKIRFLLTEWFRVLQNGGKLVLETPDLFKALKKLKKTDIETQETVLQWIYGIEDEAMKHKTGFTPFLLMSLLEDVGFTSVRIEKQLTHLYEPGLRVVCRKPREIKTWQFLFNEFRLKLKSNYSEEFPQDLTLLERNHLKEIRVLLSGLSPGNTPVIHKKCIIRLSYCNPVLVQSLNDVFWENGLISKKRFQQTSVLVKYLVKSNFHKKMFTLWAHWKKTPGKMEQDHRSFIENVQKQITDAMKSEDAQPKIFPYIESLETEEIPFFDWYFILHKAVVLFNQGIKAFYKNNYKKAKKLFIESTRLNSNNVLAYWNIARSCALLKAEIESKNYYAIAEAISSNTRIKKKIREEVTRVNIQGVYPELRKPVLQRIT